MEWAGLDSERFEQGFKTEADYFMWLTCQTNFDSRDAEGKNKEKYEVLLEKRFPQGWKKMAGRKKEADPTKMPRGHGKIRLEVMARFRDWLLTTAYRVEAPVSPDVMEKVDTIIDSSQVETDLSKLSITDKPASNPNPVSAREQNLIDPEKYQELSPNDLSALDYFNKTAQWQTAFEGRKEEAKIMAERQKRNHKESVAVQKAKEEAADAKKHGTGPKYTFQEGPTFVVTERKRSNGKVEDMDEGVSL